MRYKVSITVRLDSESDELTLDQDIESAVWEALHDMAAAGRIDEASHVDVEAEPEDEAE
jgi:hypothetical protein